MQEMGLSYFLSRFVRIIKAVFRGIACLMQGRGIVPHLEYSELYAVIGSKTPDLRGLFLRGHGNKSGDLGQKQEAEVYIPSTATAEISIEGIVPGTYRYY